VNCPKQVKSNLSHPHFHNFLLDQMPQLIALHPRFGQIFDAGVEEDKYNSISHSRFRSAKQRLIMIDCIRQQKDIEAHERDELVNMVLDHGHLPAKAPSLNTFLKKKLPAFWKSKPSVEEQISASASAACSSTTDAQFLSQLGETRYREPPLEAAVHDVFTLVHQYFQALIKKRLNVLFSKFQQLREQDCTTQIRSLADSQRAVSQRESHRIFVKEIQDANTDMS
jgi:hypothetical protein